jgi:hypothetical protein
MIYFSLVNASNTQNPEVMLNNKDQKTSSRKLTTRKKKRPKKNKKKLLQKKQQGAKNKGPLIKKPDNSQKDREARITPLVNPILEQKEKIKKKDSDDQVSWAIEKENLLDAEITIQGEMEKDERYYIDEHYGVRGFKTAKIKNTINIRNKDETFQLLVKNSYCIDEKEVPKEKAQNEEENKGGNGKNNKKTDLVTIEIFTNWLQQIQAKMCGVQFGYEPTGKYDLFKKHDWFSGHRRDEEEYLGNKETDNYYFGCYAKKKFKNKNQFNFDLKFINPLQGKHWWYGIIGEISLGNKEKGMSLRGYNRTSLTFFEMQGKFKNYHGCLFWEKDQLPVFLLGAECDILENTKAFLGLKYDKNFYCFCMIKIKNVLQFTCKTIEFSVWKKYDEKSFFIKIFNLFKFTIKFEPKIKTTPRKMINAVVAPRSSSEKQPKVFKKMQYF